MHKLIFILLSLICSCHTIHPQIKPNKNKQKVDELFEKYNRANSPGYALGIIENGKLTYSKGFGLSNLEYNIPISENSAFYIGSMAKQFTSAAILILESEGKLDLNNSVKHYIPEFPDYNESITINHLIHHTSGIRETNSLQLFQGIDNNFEEVFDTDDLYNLIISQNELNFKPGEEFRYSSGGYAILAKIIERISNMTLRAFLDIHIFKPLGMNDTFVCDDHNEIVKNRVISYWPLGLGKYEQRSQIFDAYGDGGIITTVKDLAKWDHAFYEDVLNVKNFAKKMYQKGVLNNGNQIEYARALQIKDYKGLRMITHNGGMLGFRVDLVRFPEMKKSFILLGNSAYLDPTGDILKIANIYFEGEFKEELIEEKFNRKGNVVNIKNDVLQSYSGYYWTDDENYYRRISVQNDSLFIDSGNKNNAQYLTPISLNEFSITDYYLPNLFRFRPNAIGKELVTTFGNSKRSFRQFDPKIPKTIEELGDYVGNYYSEELSSTYQIFVNTNSLFLRINNNQPIQIFPTLKHSNVIWNGTKMVWIGFGEVKFIHDTNTKVTGLEIGDSRVSGVKFIKLD